MERSRFWIVIAGCWLATSMNVVGQEVRRELPIIRQAWLDSKETPAVMGTGSWSIVPREEFIKTLKLAEAMAEAGRKSPWLLSAKYQAQIDGLALTGTSELQVHNPYEVPAWGKLNPWNLPLRPLDGNQTRRVQALSERSLGVLIRAKQTETVKLSWCLQGEERSDGKWFSLQLPSCPLATLEVTMPSPYRIDWPAGRQHLSGPFPVEGTNLRRWQFQLGGEARQEVQFVVREPFEQRQVAWTESRMDADFVVGQQEVLARYEIDVQRWHDRLRSLTLDLPAGLKVKALSLRQYGINSPLNWQMQSPSALTVTLPEVVEQRAILVLDGEWAIKPGERLLFATPGVRGVLSMKPTLRIVTALAQPLVDWDFGGYTPAQGPQRDRLSEAPAEVVTLMPHAVLDSRPPKAPSARRYEQSQALTYQQDTWWHIGRQVSQVIVREQISALQGQQEIFSWQIPSGWMVKDVSGDGVTAVQAWTWHAGHPLDVQLINGLRPGQKVTLKVTLVPQASWNIDENSKTMAVPNLIPVIPGHFSGTYAITLEHLGVLQPISLNVIKEPGTRMSFQADRSLLWSSISEMPDIGWQLHDAAAGGAVQLQEWPATARAVMETNLLTGISGDRVEYRLKVQPVAGRVAEWPVRFNAPVAGLTWKSMTLNVAAPLWTSTGPESGILTWQNALTEPCEVVAETVWTAGSVVPLISSPKPFVGLYSQGKNWLPLALEKGLQLSATMMNGSSWHYEKQTVAFVPQRVETVQLSLINPRVVSRIDGDVVESDYETKVEPHGESVTLQFPKDTQVITAEINGKSISVGKSLVLAASGRVDSVRVTYRSKIHDNWGLWSWKPAIPEWSKETVPAVEHRVVAGQPLIAMRGLEEATTYRESVMTTPGDVVVWVSAQLFFAGMIAIALSSWYLSLAMPIAFSLLMLVGAGFAAVMLPGLWRLLPVALCLGVVIARRWTLGRRTPRLAVVLLFLGILFVGSRGMAQGEREVEWVYVIPGEKGQVESAQVLVSAPLWNQVKKMAGMTSAGQHSGWWISEVKMEGGISDGRARLTAVWKVITETDDVETPWPAKTSPVEVMVDGQQVQPHLSVGLFGLRRLAIPVRKAGGHEVKIVWEAPVTVSGGNQSLELKLPGAAVQSLNLSGVGEGLNLQGSTGTWQVTTRGMVRTLEAEVGMARGVTLSWPSSNLNSLQAFVDVGVLWEHRVHQSVAHAVLAYHIETGRLDEMTVDLPENMRVKSVSVVGEVQAAVQPRLKKWKLALQGSKQRLQVMLQRPVNGTVHLLLELPWLRDGQEGIVPLAGVDPAGITTRHGFVAYLVDGVVAKALAPLSPVLNEDYDFARPWLPSLGLLPRSAISALGKPGDPEIKLQLQSPASELRVKTQCEVALEQQEVVYRYQVTMNDQQKPVIYLTGQVDSGLVVSDVSGDQVVRWNQSSAGAGQASQLSIWLNTGTQTDKRLQCTVTIRRPLELNSERQVRLPIYQIKWDGGAEAAIPLVVRNGRLGKLTLVDVSPGIVPFIGPWLDTQKIAFLQMPNKQQAMGSITLHEEHSLVRPHAVATWERSGTDQQGHLALSATEGMLPSQIEMVVEGGELEQNWHFESGVVMTSRPSRGAAGALIWTLQMSKPVNKLVIRYIPKRYEEGQQVAPHISFPAWPELVISKPQ